MSERTVTYWPVELPGRFRRQRHDRRRTTPKPPPEPLVHYFTPRELVVLERRVQAARRRARAPRRHSRDGSVRCPLCAPLRCSKAPD